MKRLCVVIGLTVSFLVFSFLPSLAQTSLTSTAPWGSWFIGTVQLPAGEKKWGGFAEVQARGNAVFRQLFYRELKGGVSYDLSQHFTFTLAGGHYATYDYREISDGPLNTEKRIWQQLVVNQHLSRLKFEHRYRVEQRWFINRDGSTPFRNRVRYRLNMFVPLNGPTITAKTAFLSVFDELFLNPKGPTFERNRVYAGFGYQINKQWIVQAGWVNQTNYNPAMFESGVFTPQSATGKNNILLSLTYRLGSGRDSRSSNKLPSQAD